MTRGADQPAMQGRDFDTLYRGGEATLVEGFSLDMIPWAIEGPQPIIVELERAGEIIDPVLDAGCGLGENAMFLAERGHRVTGFDYAPAAVNQDRDKARARGLKVEFVAADATTLKGLHGPFRTVVDSALLHCLNEEQRQQYLDALHRICEPGARMHVLCISDDKPENFPAPVISESDLRSAFSNGWTIHRFQRAVYTTTLTRDSLRRLMDRASFPHMDVVNWAVDDAGRLLLPIWQITAVRN